MEKIVYDERMLSLKAPLLPEAPIVFCRLTIPHEDKQNTFNKIFYF